MSKLRLVLFLIAIAIFASAVSAYAGSLAADCDSPQTKRVDAHCGILTDTCTHFFNYTLCGKPYAGGKGCENDKDGLSCLTVVYTDTSCQKKVSTTATYVMCCSAAFVQPKP